MEASHTATAVEHTTHTNTYSTREKVGAAFAIAGITLIVAGVTRAILFPDPCFAETLEPAARACACVSRKAFQCCIISYQNAACPEAAASFPNLKIATAGVISWIAGALIMPPVEESSTPIAPAQDLEAQKKND